MQFIDQKAQEKKIEDFRSVIASAAKRSIHMVLDCRSRIRSFAMTSVYPLKCVLNLMNK